MYLASHPILACEEAKQLEESLFRHDELREWAAMQQAGAAVAAAVLRDFEEIGGFPESGRLLVLVGKGHNGGDALIAARNILHHFPAATAHVMFVFGERALRPLAARAWRELSHGNVSVLGRKALPQAEDSDAAYALCLDGIFGFQFCPPAEPRVAKLIDQANVLPIRLRAAVDLPSAGLFRADFTYATGSVKAPVFDGHAAGRVRYLDLGFFGPDVPGHRRVLLPAVLSPLAKLRSPDSDKRSYGHLFVLGGSRSYPGAVLMAVLSALRTGVGLVTAFIPESLVPAYAARVPEAMWVGWPETPAGGLALEGLSLLRERVERADALLMGPGISRDAETAALIAEIVKTIPLPAVLDADALQPKIIAAAKAHLVLTPHAGEFARIAGNATLEEFAAQGARTVVLKGPITRIASSGNSPAAEEGGVPRVRTYHSFHGGPVLARGGSGDLLAGVVGGLLAQSPAEPELAAARGVVWHGMAADLLARVHGQVAVTTTQLLEFMAGALKEI